MERASNADKSLKLADIQARVRQRVCHSQGAKGEHESHVVDAQAHCNADARSQSAVTYASLTPVTNQSPASYLS